MVSILTSGTIRAYPIDEFPQNIQRNYDAFNWVECVWSVKYAQAFSEVESLVYSLQRS